MCWECNCVLCDGGIAELCTGSVFGMCWEYSCVCCDGTACWECTVVMGTKTSCVLRVQLCLYSV